MTKRVNMGNGEPSELIFAELSLLHKVKHLHVSEHSHLIAEFTRELEALLFFPFHLT